MNLQTNTIKLPQEKKSLLTSVLLITESNISQTEQLLNYLIKKSLVPLNSSFDTLVNLPNIHLYNQEGTGLKIETVRKIIEECSFSNINKHIRVISILNAQQSSNPAQNALLKIIEEPPINTQIVLVTSQPSQILPTIRSRCIEITFSNKQKLNIKKTTSEIEGIAQELIDESIFSLSRAIEIADQYKKREEALLFTKDIIIHFHSQLKVISNSNLSKKTIFILEEFLKAYQDLQKNYNSQLTLENYLFNIVRKYQVQVK